MAAGIGVKVTTSDDIFFEINGRRVAGVESYDTNFTNDTKFVDAFGQKTPVGYAEGSQKHTIDISRVYLEDTAIADGIDFYNLRDFDMVIIKNGRRITYKNCIISAVSESGQLKDRVAEKISLMALERKAA